MDDAVETGESNEDEVEAELALVAVDEVGGDADAQGEGPIRESASPCRGESSGIGELNHASAANE